MIHLSPILAASRNIDLIDLILNARGKVLLDLIVLIGFSFITWYIIVFKAVAHTRASRLNKSFLDTFWSGVDLETIYKKSEGMQQGPLAQVYIAGYKELAKLKSSDATPNRERDAQNLERALKRSAMVEITRLEALLPIMATIAATAPFLGLFGTVWGIMVYFSAIGAEGTTALATVAPGIVDALVTTALGLIAAIPATIAYNYFLRKVRLQVADMETFANDFMNIAQRKFFQ